MSSNLLIIYSLGMTKTSFANTTLSDKDRLHKINSYWKFIILRNPLERLVSAFRDKLEGPFTEKGHWFFEPMKRSVMRRYYPKKLQQWIKSKRSFNISLDFQTYIRWIVDIPNYQLNEHFAPTSYISHPCKIQYHFYGNFKHISSEMHLVMNKFNIPDKYFYDKNYYKPGKETASYLQEYYANVSTELKAALFHDFYTELDFYYHLFPEDRESHMKLLGVEEAITLNDTYFASHD